MCVPTAKQQVCHSHCVCSFVIFFSFFFFLALQACALLMGDLCWKEKERQKSLSLTSPGTSSSLYLPLPPHLSPLLPLRSSSSTLLALIFFFLPCDFLLSLSQRADSSPGNCMSAVQHTCCCQCSLVWERIKACPLTSEALTPSPPASSFFFSTDVGNTASVRICGCSYFCLSATLSFTSCVCLLKPGCGLLSLSP